MHFFTSAFLYKGSIYYTGYEGKKRIKRKVKYEPYLFWHSTIHPNDEGWKTLEELSVSKKTFSSISDANRWLKEMKPVENFTFYGNTNFLYTWINDTFPDKIEYDSSLVNVIYLDIEVQSDRGFPNYKNAIHPITAITISKRGKKITFGCKEYKPKSADVAYVHCTNEKNLLERFLSIWNNPKYNPDVLTGWNIEMFDVPYLYNRIKRILGETAAQSISPWGIVEEREVARKFKDTTDTIYDIKGISTLDYLSLYRKFSFKNQESYQLGFVASNEVGAKKIDYSEYDSLIHLYEQNPEKFFDYNIRDVELVEKLDDKLKLIEQVFALAYDAKVVYADTLTTIRMWDTIIHNYLLKRKIVVPQNEKNPDDELIGAYVIEPQLGMHKWVVTFDLASLYPHLIIQYNIGPETFVAKDEAPLTLEDVINGQLSILKDECVKANLCITANLCYYHKGKQSFLAAIMEKIYKERAQYKKLMIAAKNQFEQTKDPEIKKKIAQYDYMQTAKKIQMNAGYGAIANKYFRYYDHNNAEAITATGQLAIHWIANRFNKYLGGILKNDKDYVIAGDTDSLHVSMDDLVKKVGLENAPIPRIVNFLDEACKVQFQNFMDKAFAEMADYTNACGNYMQMKREYISNKAVWTSKKRYILNVYDAEGVRYEEPQQIIKGIESVRSSTPSACRDAIKKCLDIIMNEDQAALLKFIENFESNFSKLPLNEVSFNSSINGLDKYGDAGAIYALHTPLYVKGSLIYNHVLAQKGLDKKYPKIYNGDKVKYLYLKMPNPIRQKVIAFTQFLPKEFGADSYVDYELQYEKGFVEPVKRITEVIGWKIKETASLDAFM